MSIFLPEEIMVHILKRLPVKSILRFRCTLLHDTSFVNMHLNYHHSIENNNFSLMLITSFLFSSYKSPTHYFDSIDYDSSSSSSSSLLSDDEGVNIDSPFKSPYDSVFIIGSCNGLISMFCLPASSENSIYIWNPSLPEPEDLICIWNPSTKECKEIPIERKPKDYIIRYGFGYDCKFHDYKLVRIMGFKGDSFCEVEVLTLGSNKWRSIQNIPKYYSDNIYSGVLVNGALHWMETYQDLISFDLGDERFQQVPQPELEEHHMPFKFVGMLGGCLCIYGRLGKSWAAGFEVWVMKDYGVRESWFKLFTITPQIMNRISLRSHSMNLRPIQSLATGEILLLDDKALVLYDPKHETARTMTYVNADWLSVKSYVGSLVSLNSGTHV